MVEILRGYLNAAVFNMKTGSMPVEKIAILRLHWRLAEWIREVQPFFFEGGGEQNRL